MGFVSEISRPEMKPIAGNNDRRVKQTMLYFKGVAISGNKLYPYRSVCDTLHILLFLYHNFLKTIYFL